MRCLFSSSGNSDNKRCEDVTIPLSLRALHLTIPLSLCALHLSSLLNFLPPENVQKP
jgi:hypothetical protein